MQTFDDCESNLIKKTVSRFTDELGLPVPKPYDGPNFTVYDYRSYEYATARTLNEKIEIRGLKALLADAEPDDFTNGGVPGAINLGIAELWADSTWTEGLSRRDIEREQVAAGVMEGDLLEVKPCSAEVSECGYAFYRPNGSLLPYTPFHDYDDLLFEKALAKSKNGEQLVCLVRETICYGGTVGDADPDFNWRVYSAKVTVMRVPSR